MKCIDSYFDGAVKLVSIGKKKAEVIVVQGEGKYKSYLTRHLLKEGSVWKDNYGNTYTP